MVYLPEHFEKVDDSLYISNNGLEAAIINDAGTGIIEVGVSEIERNFINLLRFSALGRIVQNPETTLLFHDHFHDGFKAKYCYGGATYSFYHLKDAVPIKEEHLKVYQSFYKMIDDDELDGVPSTAKVQATFASLKALSRSLHRLAMVITLDHIGRDTWFAKLLLIGRNSGIRRENASLSTATFDEESDYFIARYETDFKRGTRELKTYSRKERQLQLFEPQPSI